ncbi:MAG: class I tRNA ligase family protein, partial [Alphaproteobacteria bacterium]|nr:class I tRNA ligase family protein [Alphaproteobacteria bacterium]
TEIVSNQISALASLSLCLKNILKLFAPFIPHITEEIYESIFADEFFEKKSIHARKNFAQLPAQLTKNSVEIIKIGDEILKILFEVRKFKSEKNLSMKTPIVLLKIGSNLDLSSVVDDISNVCNAQKIEINSAFKELSSPQIEIIL